MGIAKKTDGRYIVGIGVTDANDYKGSAAYRDIFIQLTESGASDKSLDYLNYLKDYAIYHNSLGEPIMPPSVNVWISNHGVTTAVEADDLSLDGSNYTIGGIKWDGSAWDYTNAGQEGGGGGGGTSILVANLMATDEKLRLDKTWRECINADLVIVHPETNTGKFYYVIGIEQVSSNYNVTIAMPDFLGETNISWSGYTLTTDTETGYPEFTDV